MNKYENLKSALLKAKKAAEAAYQDDDGGTSNFDSPTIRYREMHMQKRKVEEVIESVGLSCFNWRGFDQLIISGMTSGQGNRRTEMAKAFSKKLNALGVPSDMYYQMD